MGCSDKSAPIEICKLQNIDRKQLLNLQIWFTGSRPTVTNPVKRCLASVGIDYHTIYRGNHRWGSQKSPLEQEKELISCIPTDTD